MDDGQFADAIKQTRTIVDKLNAEPNLVLSENVQDDEETLTKERKFSAYNSNFRQNSNGT